MLRLKLVNSCEFNVNKGLRQGDAITPLSFNVVLEIAVETSQIEIWGITFDKCSQILIYADDVVLQEEDYWMLKKYLHHWLNKQIRWD
jgi:hypothetical protein